MNIRDLRAVLILAEEGHFGRAANRLGMAQPQLSQLISRIEAAWSVRIFERRPNVVPTLAGEVVVETARGVVADLQKGLDQARQVQAGMSGAIRVGFVFTAMLTEIAEAVGKFGQSHSEIRLELSEMTSTGLIEALRARKIDVAFARDVRPQADLEQRTLVSEPFVLFVPEAHRFSRREAVDRRELEEEPLITFRRSRAPALYDTIASVGAAAGAAPRLVQEVEGWPAALALVRSGFGLVIAPAALSQLVWPGVACVGLEATEARSTIDMLWNRQASPAAENFVARVGSAPGAESA